ncbi:MAG: ORF6N domain-containing protein [Ignavibacteriales bacterium]|nr:ORF6N domain-containing protein [Ignavibacteriales bacterium]
MKSKHNTTELLINIDTIIFNLREEKVILDFDLAKIYGIPTYRLNEAVKRNRERFPEDFLFQLTKDEYNSLKSQIAMSKTGRGGRRTFPYAFTEHGTIMAANVLNSHRAIQMSLFIVRAFIKMRQTFSASKVLSNKLEELEKNLTDRLNIHEKAILHILDEIKKLMPPPSLPEPKRRRIGF